MYHEDNLDDSTQIQDVYRVEYQAKIIQKYDE